MRAKTPVYAYILAISLGIVVLFASASASYTILALVFFTAGSLFGFFWPRLSWRWGLWITAPLIAFLLLSVAFSGYLNQFLNNDLPPLLVALVAACLGSFVFSMLKRAQKVSDK